ncbi:hypothetical protein [Mucilaginibacter ginkgonis]|uniref:Dolichyl-phosphate-mannose-protein mannosyltransferase n=1 Tax=Mucilaginibacter ginkgonis TaxID=2682091 RepID=A0A6I4IMT8_9SPHI|nr:hypothetical protein [Mucilaginibacter ginkgonis]QQL50104.1 hypothetical protein GO620_001230 [Mucilaginibacter ginkgonis]
MIANAQRRSDFAFLLAFFFINLVGVMLALSALSFAVGISISPVHFPLSIIIALVTNYFLSARYYFVKDNAVFLRSVLLIVGLSIVSFLIAGYFFDSSIDGQTYHQNTIIQLKNGWNPFHQELPADMQFSIWLNHYGKGAEIPQAVVYAFFNKIETGKATNFFLFLGAFFLTVSLLFKFNRFTTFKVYLLAAILTFNPVILVQLLSYCIDSHLALMLQCLFLLGCFLLIDKDKFKLWLLPAVIIIALNIKFTAIIFVGVLVIGILVTLLYRKDVAQFKKVFITAALATFAAIAVVGYNPYVTNTVDHKNPFYPLAGKGKIDIMTRNSPMGFPKNNRFHNLFTSLFSRTANMLLPQTDQPQLKVPFTFKMQEMRFSYEEDIRIGGFGVLFSGIIILSLILAIFTIRQLSKPTRALLAFMIGTILVSVFIFEYSWWARYAPQIWFLPIIILAFSEICTGTPVKWVRNITYVLIVLNLCLLGAVSLFKNLVATQKTKYQLAELKTLKDTVTVDFDIYTDSRLKFTENNIPFKEAKLDSASVNFPMKYIHAMVHLKTQPQPLPQPYLFKLDEVLKSKSH